MPLVVIDRIVVDPPWRAEGLAAVAAAHEHHVGPDVEAKWLHTSQEIDIVICTRAGAVHCDKQLTDYSFRIDLAGDDVASQINRSGEVERGGHPALPGVGRANAPNLSVIRIYPGEKKIAIRIHIECAPLGRAGNIDRIDPGEAAIGGTAELPGTVVIAGLAPALVLESVSAAGGVIDREPLLVPSGRGSEANPGLAAVQRSPYVVEKIREQAEIEKTAGIIGGQHRVAAKNAVLENVGKRPRLPTVAGVSPAGLAEVRLDVIELPPADGHLVRVRRVH